MSQDSEKNESAELTDTVPTNHGADGSDAKKDVMSDPALADNVGADWADEGGATPVGPATSTAADSEEDADSENDGASEN